MSKITVVIVTYHSRGCISDALAALAVAIQEGLVECTVVDNESKDGTAEFIEQQYPWVRLMRAGENLGFGRGCNLGYKDSQSDYILFLNPDAVIEPDAIRLLLNFMEKGPRVGIAAPAIIEPQGTLQPSFVFPSPASILAEAVGLNRFIRFFRYIIPGSAPRRVDCVGGALMLVRRTLLDQLNGFDPRYFLYFEETDLCLRASRAGWEVWTVGEAIARHTNAVSTLVDAKPMHRGCIAEHFYQSRYYYLVTNYGRFMGRTTELGELVLLANRSLFRALFGRRPDHRFRERLQAPFLKLPSMP